MSGSVETNPKRDDASINLRAAQYVRMSTDHQKYSTQNQKTTIAEYAARHAMTIVRTYTDEARSGVKLDGRQALKDIIGDVLAGRADFDRILVYDVSRWGRFQDPDESAHYEFICKEAGVRVEYCAEEFQDDGSVMSTVWKHMKRAFAGEYSRDLSRKVFAAQCRLGRLGFRQGGPPGYGLRRLLLDEQGNVRCVLTTGQRKHLQTDRVILQPGDAHEVELVRDVFRQFVAKNKTEARIARELNEWGVPNHRGRKWTSWAIRFMLNNHAYVGANVYNRKTMRLGQKVRNNSPNLWIQAPGAFEAIIHPDLFAGAQEHRLHRRYCLSDRELLARLGSLLKEKGKLSRDVIDAAEFLPSHSTYINRFGSLRDAYRQIDHVPLKNLKYIDARRAIVGTLSRVGTRVVGALHRAGESASFDLRKAVIKIDGRTVLIRVFRFRLEQRRWGRWITARPIDRRHDMLLLVRMDDGNLQIRDYFLVPSAALTGPHLSLTETNQGRLESYRADTLDAVSKSLMALGNPARRTAPAAPKRLPRTKRQDRTKRPAGRARRSANANKDTRR